MGKVEGGMQDPFLLTRVAGLYTALGGAMQHHAEREAPLISHHTSSIHPTMCCVVLCCAVPSYKLSQDPLGRTVRVNVGPVRLPAPSASRCGRRSRVRRTLQTLWTLLWPAMLWLSFLVAKSEHHRGYMHGGDVQGVYRCEIFAWVE